MKTNYVLVDCENVPAPAISLLKGGHFRVILFLGPNNSKLKKALSTQPVDERLECIEMAGSGKNALDFHIAYYLGKLSSEDPSRRFYIISKDRGFDPLIRHVQSLHISISRLKSIEAITGTQPRKLPTAASDVTDEKKYISKAITALRKRKGAWPASEKALRRTIQSDCGRDLPDSVIDSVYNAIFRKGYVKVEKNKVLFIGL
jgi:hypothetical protein